VIKTVSDLLQVGGFLSGTPVSSTNKIDCQYIAEILLKVVLNTINHTSLAVILKTYLPIRCTGKKDVGLMHNLRTMLSANIPCIADKEIIIKEC